MKPASIMSLLEIYKAFKLVSWPWSLSVPVGSWFPFLTCIPTFFRKHFLKTFLQLESRGGCTYTMCEGKVLLWSRRLIAGSYVNICGSDTLLKGTLKVLWRCSGPSPAGSSPTPVLNPRTLHFSAQLPPPTLGNIAFFITTGFFQLQSTTFYKQSSVEANHKAWWFLGLNKSFNTTAYLIPKIV